MPSSVAGVADGTYGALSVSAASGTGLAFPVATQLNLTRADNVVAGMAPAGAFTVMTWIKPVSVTTAGNGTILGTGLGAGGYGWGFGLNTTATGDSSILWRTYTGTSLSSRVDNLSQTFSIAAGSWAHFALSYNNGVVTYFLNGVQLDSDTRAFTASPAGSQALVISGRYNVAGESLPVGTILDGLRVYDNALTASEIQYAAVESVSAVPEPSTYGLLGAGVLAASAFARRRRLG